MKKELEISIKDRLLGLARKRGVELNILLNEYLRERFLYRLSISKYKESLCLKGGCLFVIWEKEPHRVTKDIDFAWTLSDQSKKIDAVINEISSIDCKNDGLRFDTKTIKSTPIRANKGGGIQIQETAFLGKIPIYLQVDIGFGDAITPLPIEETIPSLLGMEDIKIKTYPIYTVIAEKLEAMVALGDFNSRMKDFYDLWFLMHKIKPEDEENLKKAVKNTFLNRKTNIGIPVSFSKDFAVNKEKDWVIFLKRINAIKKDFELKDVIFFLKEKLGPLMLTL